MEFRIASTREDYHDAFALIFREYSSRGYVLPRHYPNGLRITLFNLHPETRIFIAVRGGRVVATCSLIPDSLLGLPLDMGYRAEGNALRAQRRKVCEGAYLAIDRHLFSMEIFSLFNASKLDFLLCLFKMVLQYAIHHSGFDDLLIVTDPKYAIFQFLPFETFGDVRQYGYDRVWLKKKAAILKRFDIECSRRTLADTGIVFANRRALDQMLVQDVLPSGLFTKSTCFSKEDIRFFFYENSDILDKVHGERRRIVLAWHGLTEGDIEAWKVVRDVKQPCAPARRSSGD